MKRYLIVILAILVLASVLTVGCSQATVTYRNEQFGYSVLMPQSWEVVDKPVDITGEPKENTIGFRSELSPGADWVRVKVKPGESAYSAVTSIPVIPNISLKVYEYGKNGYVVESRLLLVPSDDWRITYYIEYNDNLYKITFDKESTAKKVYVSIDGYGKVNH